MVRQSYENNFDISFPVILPLSQEMDLCLALTANTKYIVVYRFLVLNLNSIEYLGLTNCYGKANKKRMPWRSEASLGVDCLIVS